MQTASEILPGTRSWGTETSPDSLMRLQGVLSELYRAVRNALQDERESAEECLQRAVAMLEAGGYVTCRRVELAQGLMLTTDAPVGQIAAYCGLADQSGPTPFQWTGSSSLE